MGAIAVMAAGDLIHLPRRGGRGETHTEDPSKLTDDEKGRLRKAVSTLVVVPMPATRADCVDGPRPCPFARCRYHLALDVDERTGSIKHNFPDVDAGEWEHSCALDAADSGGMTLAEIGEQLNVTRERVRQIEARAKLKMYRRAGPALKSLLDTLDSARAERPSGTSGRSRRKTPAALNEGYAGEDKT